MAWLCYIIAVMSSIADTSAMPYDEMQNKLNAAADQETLFKAVVNLPFDYKVPSTLLFLGVIVLLLVNKKDGTINRIAVTDNERADGAKKMSVKRFEDIKIPLNYKDNLIVEVIDANKPRGTADWQYLFNPVLTPEEARLNQAGASIGYSAVYPLGVGDGGALIFSYFEYPEGIGQPQRDFMKKYSDMVTECLKYKL